MAELVDQIIWTVTAVFGLILISGLTLFIILNRRFKITYVIRHLRKGRVHIEIDKARVIKTRIGTAWKTRKTKQIVPIPPDEAIEIREKGGKYVEAYWSEDANIIEYIKDDPDKKKLEGLEPSIVAQKMLFAQEVHKAEKRGMDFWARYGGLVVSGGVVITLFVLIFAFWSEIWQPLTDMSSALGNTAKQLQLAAEKMAEVTTGQQIIRPPAPPG